MSNNNYNKYYSKNNKTSGESVKPDVKEESIKVEEEIVETEENVIDDSVKENISEDLAEETNTPTVKIGRVYSCKKLNVRKHPNLNSEIICEIPVGTSVEIVVDDLAANEFYKVHIESGEVGFCMKDYIEVV